MGIETVAFLELKSKAVEPIAGFAVEPHLVVYPLFGQIPGEHGESPVLGWGVLYQPSGRTLPTGAFAGSGDAIEFAKSVSELLEEEPKGSFFWALKDGQDAADKLLKKHGGSEHGSVDRQ